MVLEVLKYTQNLSVVRLIMCTRHLIFMNTFVGEKSKLCMQTLVGQSQK